MKIAYVVHGFTNSGGTERVLATKANYLIKQGFSVSIITLENEGKDPFFYFDPAIEIIRLGKLKNTSKDRKNFVAKLTNIFNTIQPDISIATDLGLTRYLYKVKDDSKKILEYHFSKYKRKYRLASLDKNYFGRCFNNLYYHKKINAAKKYERFVVLTEQDKESWYNVPNIQVIPNPLSFVPQRCADLGYKRVIAVGRYTYQKGFDSLIYIWAEINKRFPDWKLSIFGNGHKKDYLQSIIDKLNLTDKIELLPPTLNIEQEYLRSSVFVVTSRYEGFSLVLTEAMACGLPSVSYSCRCGPKDIIRNGEDGFLTDVMNKKQFVEKLSLLMEDHELRKKMGQAAHFNVQRFREPEIMSKWIALFDDLVSKHH